MKILCWNIENITRHKIDDRNIGQYMLLVMRQFDVIVILEGPAQGHQTMATYLAQMLGNYTGYSVGTPALGQEAESVLVLVKGNNQIGDIKILSAHGIPNDIRHPIWFSVTGASDLFDDPTVQYTWNVMAWHAPPKGKGDLRTQAWTSIKNQLPLVSDGETMHVMLGDFNAPLSVPNGYVRATPELNQRQAPATPASGMSSVSSDAEARQAMSGGPTPPNETTERLQHGQNPYGIHTVVVKNNYYDRAYVFDQCPYSPAIVLDLVADYWANQMLMTGSTTRPSYKTPSWREAQYVVRSISDHLPVSISL